MFEAKKDFHDLINRTVMKLHMVAKSDVGKVREANEDFCGIFQEERI